MVNLRGKVENDNYKDEGKSFKSSTLLLYIGFKGVQLSEKFTVTDWLIPILDDT